MAGLSRRKFLEGAASAGLLAGGGRLPWQPEPPPARAGRGGILEGERRDSSVAVGPLLEPLAELGWVEGLTLVIVEPEGGTVRLPEFAIELAQRHVDVIFAAGPANTRAAW